MALVNQYQVAHGGINRQGNANHILYQLVKKPSASCTSTPTPAAGCTFYDVTKGNSYLATRYGTSVGTNSVACAGGSPNCSVSTVGSNGVLVDPNQPSTEAWTAAAGYDMVTGLGTVNAFNLATNWSTVSTVSTTTSLALSPAIGITHGLNENVTVNISVTPKSGTATGQVSLIATFPDGTTHGLDQFTLTNGAVGGAKTQSLPGGAYAVSAHYAGDGTNAFSDSSPVQVTVGKETSQAFIVIPSFDSSGNLISGNATSVTYGSRYIIRMYVTDKNGVASTTGPPSPTCAQENLLACPSGTITLTDNGALVDTGGGGPGVYNLNDFGYTRDLAPNLLGGVHPLLATYGGDNSFLKNTGTATLTVTPASTQTQINGYPPTIVQGQTFQLEANVTAQLNGPVAYPGGAVTFYDGNTPLPGTVQISQGGNGQIFADLFNVSLSSTGTPAITAKYGGDRNYAPSTSSPVAVTLLITTAITQTVSPTSINYGQSVTVTAVLTSNSKGPAFMNQIFFGVSPALTNITTTPGTDGNGNQMLTVTGTLTPPQTESIYAYYVADANYASSFSANTLITVNIPEFSLKLPSTPFNVTAGQSGTLQINVTPASNVPSPVTLSCNGNLPIGYSCSVQPATVNLANGVPSPVTLTVSPLPPGAAAIGNIVTLKHAVIFQFPFGPNPLWPLTLLSGLAALLSLIWSGKKRTLRPPLGFGLVCILSLIIGCGGGSGGPPPPPPGPSATTTAVTLSSPKVAPNAPLTFTAKATGQGNPTGTVSFYVNGNFQGSSNLVAGSAAFNTSLIFPGIYSVTAQYLGDTNNLASKSPGVSEAITGATVFQVNGQTGPVFHSVDVTVTVQ